MGQIKQMDSAFSVKDGIPHPPSLVNIFKEIKTDVGIPYPQSGNLERWAEQGVLLLNATLTVRAHQAGSHQKKRMEDFTDAVIKTLSQKKEGLVFLLWGGFAKRKLSAHRPNKTPYFKVWSPIPVKCE